MIPDAPWERTAKKGDSETATKQGTRGPHAAYLLAGALAALLLGAGCISPPLEEFSPYGPESEQFAPLELALRTIGDPPENVSALTFTVKSVALLEKQTGQWVQVHTPMRFTLIPDDPSPQAGVQWTLPAGKYTEARVSLQEAHVIVDGQEYPVRLVENTCQVPVSFVLHPDSGRTRLEIFLWIGDALEHTEEGWQGRPAFGGSYSSNGETAKDGAPRLGDTRC